MSSNHSEDIFSRKVIPIMNKVRDDLQHKRADEMEKHSFSLAGLMVGAIGPDGGSAATQAFDESLYYTGKWNSKTVEDYVEMVKAELKKQHIKVTPEIEKKMNGWRSIFQSRWKYITMPSSRQGSRYSVSLTYKTRKI